MRIGLLTGSLEQGGAERQLSELAVGLKRRGHEVDVVAYVGGGAYESFVAGGGVPVRQLGCVSKLGKVLAVRRWRREFRPEVVHGFMKRASVLASLAAPPWSGCKVIGSDYSTASYGAWKPAFWFAIVFFALAHAVVTETEMNRSSLVRAAPWLRKRTRIIRNGVDTSRFTRPKERHPHPVFRFVCVGTVYPVKNPVRVVEAARILRDRSAGDFQVDWYGRLGSQLGEGHSAAYQESARLIEAQGLSDKVSFHGPHAKVEEVYQAADALLHVSIQEGISNAVVEAMASGLPIVVGRVSDLPLVVQEARNGYHCDQMDPESIADAMQRLMQTDPREREAMGQRSHDLAERWFGLERFIEDHEKLYRSLCQRTPP